MSAPTEDAVREALGRVIDPELHRSITDLGMVGAQNSVLGVRTDLVIQKFRTGMPVRFDMAEGPAEYAAVIVDIDPAGQHPASIESLLLREAE